MRIIENNINKNIINDCHITTNHVYGITGSLGVGKSSLAKELRYHWNCIHDSYLYIIELDDIRRYVLWESIDNEHVALRIELAKLFSLTPRTEYAWLERSEFTRILFSSKKKLQDYSLIATPVLKAYVQKEIKKHPYCLLVWAYLIEEDYLSLINKFTLLVNTPAHIVLKRFYQVFSEDNLQNYDVMQRIIIEPSYESRLIYLQQQNINHYEYNNDDHFDKHSIQKLVETMIKIV